MNDISNVRMSRRQLLTAMGVGAGAFAASQVLSGCVGAGGTVAPGGGGGATAGGSAADEVTGAFDWKRASGTTLHILQTPHVYQQTYAPMFADFTELTGITVEADLVPEADYFTKLNTELAGGQATHDVFMLGAYYIWQYGPPGWLEDLDPWLKNTSATSPDFDYEDLFQGLRDSMKWDFKTGSPVGTGGTWAMPWGFEINNICYNKSVFDQKGITTLPDTFDELLDLAKKLTDRSAGQYGIAFRGSRSWATIHPGFMTQYTREGGKDYTFADGALQGVMNSPAAVTFTQKWAQLAKDSGPTSWTTYEYPNCTGDLGDGKAMMCYDADSATYPKNIAGASKMAGNLAWWPAPPGPDGSYATNIWVWCLGMNARSQNKVAAWLFMQWASGKDSMNKAVQSGAFADPVRQSVFDGTFKNTLGDFPGYLDAFEKVIGESKILFTPQTKFLETTEDWAVAVQQIYGGADAKSTLDALAQSVTKKLAS